MIISCWFREREHRLTASASMARTFKVWAAVSLLVKL